MNLQALFHGSALVLLAALALEAALPLWRVWERLGAPHPVALAGRGIARLAERGRASGGNAQALRRRGVRFAVLLATLALAAGVLLEALLAAAGAVGWLLEAAIVATLLSQRELHWRASRLFAAVEQGGAEAGRPELHHLAGRDAAPLGEAGLRRAGLESLAENLGDGTLAPALWFLLLGLPGLFLYKAANTADSIAGYDNDRWRDFGRASAKWDDLLNWLPARLAAACIALAPMRAREAGAGAAWAAAWRDGPRHRSANAGWPEAAFAAALDVRLAGPRSYFGTAVEDAWMNEGGREPQAEDCRRGLALYRAALGVFWALVAAWWLLL